MAKQFVPSVEQILRDALFHVEKGWTTGDELVYSLDNSADYGNLASSDYYDPILWDMTARQIHSQILEHIRKANDVRVCSLGGILLARGILDGKHKTKKIKEMPNTEAAIRLLAYVIEPDKAHKYATKGYPFGFYNDQYRTADVNDFASIITSWNDTQAESKKGQNRVVRKFKEAIELAMELGI